MSNNIKTERLRLQWTQEELASRVGVRRETIVFLEQGKYNPSLNLAAALAKEFHVSLEYLFKLS